METIYLARASTLILLCIISFVQAYDWRFSIHESYAAVAEKNWIQGCYSLPSRQKG